MGVGEKARRSGWRHPPTRNLRTRVYADVRAEEDNSVPLAEETFAASASPPKESNSNTAGAFVKEHLVSFELAGVAVVAASVLAIAARPRAA